MKFNWGTGITIAIVAFMSFILYMVITMSTDNSYSYDLVTENYYQQEVHFQGEIDAEQNGAKYKDKVTIQRTVEGLKIEFPKELSPNEITGKVFLYRPSNKQLDFEIPISISNTYLLVPEKRLLDGRWNINLAFKYKDKEYLIKREIQY
ncbi:MULTISPECIES: FixH family protein [unclassified Polaribacter]|uniref:FixH family protein n=1 Tax=unclassified Polaribacter TaxID=196858 RepID=UPI001C4EFCED|nr:MULTISPECIES: FixH family protein [unclassified Polaribacter]QXP63112.1 FixH family protein [Polaribacter sp. HaHaR_3_91]QXP65622.1 FixH family protein [Polaribacter sp. AHE13PA]QXP71139.1 FixH family protein [Polaribacter sp. R2A056_3_33]